jgi:hypothetical protein
MVPGNEDFRSIRLRDALLPCVHDHQPMTLSLYLALHHFSTNQNARKRYAHADDVASHGGEAFGCLLPSLRMTECNAPSVDNGFEQGGGKRANKQTH